jgi:dihydrodipicolinate synthase/N-acetylneuraminate lyase
MVEVAEALEIGSKYSASGYYTGSPTLSKKLLRLAREGERELARALGRDLTRENEAKWKSGGEVFTALLAEVRRRLDAEIEPESQPK